MDRGHRPSPRPPAPPQRERMAPDPSRAASVAVSPPRRARGIPRRPRRVRAAVLPTLSTGAHHIFPDRIACVTAVCRRVRRHVAQGRAAPRPSPAGSRRRRRVVRPRSQSAVSAHAADRRRPRRPSPLPACSSASPFCGAPVGFSERGSCGRGCWHCWLLAVGCGCCLLSAVAVLRRLGACAEKEAYKF